MTTQKINMITPRSKKDDNKKDDKKNTNAKTKDDNKKTKRLSKKKPDSESDISSSEWESESETETDSSDDEPVKMKTSKKHKKKNKKEQEDDDEDEKLDKKEYKQFLANMFPSKYSKKALKAAAAAEQEEDSEEEEEREKKHKKKHAKKSKKSSEKRKEEYSSSSSSESDECDDAEDEDDEDDDDYDDECEEDDLESESEFESDSDSESEHAHKVGKKSKKINIFLSVSKNDDNSDEYADYFGHDSDEDEDDDEDEEDECNTDDEEMFMKEKYEKVTSVDVTTETSESNKSIELSSSKSKTTKKPKSNKSNKNSDEGVESDDDSILDVESEYIELLELKKDLTKRFHKNPKSKVLKKRITECCEDIKKLVKDARKNNTKQYKKLIVNEKQKPNEMKYFKTKLSNSEQLHVMQELKEVNRFMGIDKPYRLAVLESNIPPKLKANAMQKINMLRSMDTCDPEYFKIKNWVDTFMRIPFCKYSSLSVSISDGIDKCHDFMSNAKSVLDNCVYGLDDAKLQILQMIGQWISNPQAMGTAIAIKGPPGTGKTTLVKDGISKILGREFVFIPLGGTGDSSYLEGHSYTYEGSTWGKIVQSLIDSKTMNPVFYFDELDKISDTPKGEEITGILTHMTDSTQNSQFHDKYFSDVDFDLSKCLFIFSYNDESKVNPILKDRMYRIQTKGYDAKEKIVIANKYMLPKIREQVNFKKDDVVIPDETIRYIVSSQHLTQKEDGVRNMKRCLEIIHTKLNLVRLVKPDENLFSKDITMNVTFPFTVDTKAVDVLIKNEEKQSQSLLSMYV